MVKGLIINAAISLSFLLFGNQFFKENELSVDALYKTRIFGGIINGILGCVLISFSVELTPTFIIDFRQIPIILAAFYGGWIPAVITGTIIGMFRMIYTGINQTAVIGAITAEVIAVGCALISFIHVPQRKKWTIMTVYCLVESIIVYKLLIKDPILLTQTLLCYSIGLIILSILVYYYSNYFNMSNRLIKNLKEESTKDFLTGLNNVRNFDKLYNDIIDNVTARKEQLSILILDIDFFKKVNDTYGHQCGDIVLKEMGSLLIKTCREFDIVSRNGGEEFSVLLIDCPSDKALKIGERIREAVEERQFILLDETCINITVSIGVATFPDMTNDKEILLKLADKALYKAKDTGRNRVCIVE